MSEELNARVELDKLRDDVDTLKEGFAALNDSLSKVVRLIERIQWMGTGLGLYFMLDNLGFLEALKVALKVL